MFQCLLLRTVCHDPNCAKGQFTRVPSPTRVSKSQYGGRIPSFEHHEPCKIWFVFISEILIDLCRNILRGIVENWVEFFFSLNPTLKHKSKVSPPKSVSMHADIYVILGTFRLKCLVWVIFTTRTFTKKKMCHGKYTLTFKLLYLFYEGMS